VTAEVLRRAEVCKKRQARATQMTQEPSADIRDRVIDALGELPLSQDTEWLVKEVLNRMRCNPGVYGRAPSYRVARKNILELQQKAGVSIL
jgi:hypothetical protein